MSNENEIPELLSRLEGRLGSPQPDAIRAEVSRRRAARRRNATTAGICGLILVVAAGVLWTSRDTTSETATGADDGSILDDEGTTTNNSRLSNVDAITFLREGGPHALMIDYSKAATPAFRPRLGSFLSFPSDIREDTGEGQYGWFLSDGCRAAGYSIEWTTGGFIVGEQVELEPNAGLVEGTLCEQPWEQPVLRSSIVAGQFVSVAHDPATSSIVLWSNGHVKNSNGDPIVSDTDHPWTLSVIVPNQLLTQPGTASSTTGPPSTEAPPVDGEALVAD